MLCTIVLYMGMMLAIGVAVSKKNKTAGDFFLGGRKLGPLVTAMSAEASDMSGWLLMGLPAVAMMGGLAEASWTAIGLAIGTYLNWLFVAKRLRVYSQRIDAFTIPDFFSRRFGDKNRILTLISALFIVIFFIPYTASGFAACGKLFSSLFGIDYMLAMVVSATVIVIYCTLGGFLAASTTDFVQSIVMTIALFVVVGFTEGLVHGFDVVFANVQGLDGYLDLFKGFNVATGETGSYGALPVASTLAWGLGYFGMPHILVRFMAIKKPSMVKTSAIVAISWVVIALCAVIFISVFGRMLIGEELLLAGKQSMVFIDLSRDIFPAAISGILLSAIIAASMSTADSQLLVASSSFTSDIYKPIIRKNASDKETLWVGRAVVLLVAVVAYFIASSKGDGAQAIMDLVENAWAGFGSAFGSVVILSLFWRRFTYKGAIAGVVVGAVVDIVWLIFLTAPTGIYELIPGFAASMIAAVVLTLLDKKPSAEITAIYDEATKPITDEE
jgi:sodium/proline symporter